MQATTLVVDLLAGPGEGIACSSVFELDATILLQLDYKDELIDLIACLGGEFEQRAVVLGVCDF
jgi:hypothetical protein